jgi:putative addiction module component (TIGR02574 family)
MGSKAWITISAREVSMNTAAALQSLQGYPLEERLEILFQLWDQLLDGGWKPELDEELKAELERRWKAYQANPASGKTWDQVLEGIRHRK